VRSKSEGTASFRFILRRLASGRLALDDLWLLVVPLVLLILLEYEQVRPHDFRWHLRSGRIIAETKAIPAADLFTYTRAGVPWANQGWLMQTLLYLLYRCGGLPLVIFLNALLIALGYALVVTACWRAGVTARAAGLAAVGAAALGVIHWGVRPQAASFPLFGAVVWVMESHRARAGRIIWTLPALFALWSNLHGGFVFGLGVWGLYALCRPAADLSRQRALTGETRQVVVVGALSALALSLNPNGPLGTARYVWGFLQSDATFRYNLEFQPLSMHQLDGQLFFAVLTLYLFLACRRRAMPPPDTALATILLGALSLYSRRASPWLGMAAAPAFAQALHARKGGSPSVGPSSPRAGTRWVNYLFMTVLLMLLGARLPWLRPYLPGPPEQRAYVVAAETPVQAAAALCDLGPEVRLFNDIAFGSYLIWACPDLPVFMDTRFELYPDAMWRDYLLVADARFGWEKVLARYGVNTILASRRDQSLLISAALASGDWQPLHEDHAAVILQRRPR